MGRLADKKGGSRNPPSVHVVSGTKGTSNELSLSILDERKDRLPEDESAPGSMPMHGLAGAHKASRQKKRRRWWILKSNYELMAAEKAHKADSGSKRKRSRSASRPGEAKKGCETEIKAVPVDKASVDETSDAEAGLSVWAAQEDASQGASSSRSARESSNDLLFVSGVIEGSGLLVGKQARRRGKGARASRERGARGGMPAAQGEWARRRQPFAVARSLAFALLLIALVALVALAPSWYLRNSLDGSAQLEDALDRLAWTDATVDSLDEAVSSSIDEVESDRWETVEAEILEAQAVLDEAEELATKAREELAVTIDQEIAGQVVVAVEARRQLFEVGAELLAQLEAASAAGEGMEAAWGHLLAAAELAREAALTVAEGEEDSVVSSMEKTQDALEELALAEEALASAESAFGLDVSDYRAYLEKKREALSYALSCDEAILAGDAEEAVALNDAYNEADEQAAALAEALPEDPLAFVEAAYKDSVGDLEASYSEARSLVAEADAVLSDYQSEQS